MAKTTITNLTTEAIVTHLNFHCFKAWKVYNGAVYNVKAQSYQKDLTKLKGVSDIIGFNKLNGLFIAVEVKTGKDELSPEQIEFLSIVKRAGGIAIEAKTYDDFVKQFNELKQQNKF